VAESMRVMMDTLERAVFDCGKSEEFRALFK
jgi:hypothetical protein